jgi:hypothetical protein
MTMIADHITVIDRGTTTDRVVIAPGNSIVSSVLEITTEGIFAAIEEGWMTYIGESVAMTTAESPAAFEETELEDRIMTAIGGIVAIERLLLSVRVELAFSSTCNTG